MIKCGAFSCGFTMTHCSKYPEWGFSPLADEFFPPLHGVLHTINTSNFA